MRIWLQADSKTGNTKFMEIDENLQPNYVECDFGFVFSVAGTNTQQK